MGRLRRPHPGLPVKHRILRKGKNAMRMPQTDPRTVPHREAAVAVKDASGRAKNAKVNAAIPGLTGKPGPQRGCPLLRFPALMWHPPGWTARRLMYGKGKSLFIKLPGRTPSIRHPAAVAAGVATRTVLPS